MPELIDKAKLLEYLAAIKPDEYVSAYGEAAVDVINHVETYVSEMPTIDAKPVRHGRWIPCSDRLPENNVPVLYVWRSQNGAVAVLHGWHFEIRSLGSAWHQSGMGMQRPDEEVTHWMPLPEPPKE